MTKNEDVIWTSGSSYAWNLQWSWSLGQLINSCFQLDFCYLRLKDSWLFQRAVLNFIYPLLMGCLLWWTARLIRFPSLSGLLFYCGSFYLYWMCRCFLQSPIVLGQCVPDCLSLAWCLGWGRMAHQVFNKGLAVCWKWHLQELLLLLEREPCPLFLWPKNIKTQNFGLKCAFFIIFVTDNTVFWDHLKAPEIQKLFM